MDEIGTGVFAAVFGLSFSVIQGWWNPRHQAVAEDRNTVPAATTATPKGTTKGKVLYVGNLKRSMSIHQLAAEFAPYGTITAVRLGMDKETGRFKGFGYVQFLEAADAAKAMAQMNGKLVEGHKLKVSIAHQQNVIKF